MAMNLTQWQEKSDKILGLLQSDAPNRQQALMLLDAVADSIAADGAGSAFASIFSQPNTINATFGWMQEILDNLYWSARREFEDERIFWPLYDIMLRIYPVIPGRELYDGARRLVPVVPQTLMTSSKKSLKN